MIILIRHAEDYHTQSHNGLITKHGESSAKSVGKYLIEKYGVPDEVYITPFYRGKQTAKMLLTSINTNSNIKIKTSKNLSRYTRDKANLSITVPEYETKDDVKERTRHFLNKHSHHQGKIFWCITHAIVVKYGAKILGLNPNKNIKFLDYYVKN